MLQPKPSDTRDERFQLFASGIPNPLDITLRMLLTAIHRKLRRKPTAAPGETNALALFVLSTGRTGTTTVAALYDLIPTFEVLINPLPHIFHLNCLAYCFGQSEQGLDIACEAFRREKVETIQNAWARGLGYVDASADNAFLGQVILRLIPQAKFIHLVRSPQDVVKSGMKRKWYRGHVNDAFRITPDESSISTESWNKMDAFEQCCWFWAETNRWIDDFLAPISAEQKLRVCSEDIFKGDPESIASLYAFAGIPLPSWRRIENVLDLKLNAQISDPDTIQFDDPDTWDPEMWEKLNRIAGPIAQRFGYDLPDP